MTNEEKIIEYLNGEMKPSDKSDFEIEINNDPGLQKMYKDYNQLFESIEEIPFEIPSEKLKTNILHVVNQESKKIKLNIGIF